MVETTQAHDDVTPAPEPGSRAEFDALVAKLAAIDAVPLDDDTPDSHFDLAGETIGKIMDMPAPDAGALRWKLDWVLDPSDGSGPHAYDRSYLAQTVADYRRFLPDQPDQPKTDDWPANLAAYRKVSDEYRQFIIHGDGSDAIGDPLSRRWAETCDALMLTPAPDNTALAVKLAIFNDENLAEDWHCASDVSEAMAADAARLTWAANMAALDRVNVELDAAQEDEPIDKAALDQLWALVAMFTTPAPDATALARKLELFKEHGAWGFYETPEIVDALIADARRLTEAGAGMSSAG